MIKAHRVFLAIFAATLVIAVIAAFVTARNTADIRSASTEKPSGTVGLARPHSPIPPNGISRN